MHPPGPSTDRPSAVFTMDQIAGHVTNYRNLRAMVEADGRLEPTWVEIDYYREGGLLERLGSLPLVPSYLTGVARAGLIMRSGHRTDNDPDVLFTNASVALFFSRDFRRLPSIYDFDSTPMQLDAMPAYTAKPDPAPIARLKYLGQRRLFRSAHLLQAWSDWAKRSVVDDYGIAPDKIIVNPPGLDLSLWPEAERTWFGESDRAARVLFVGADFERKGGHDLLEWMTSRQASDYEVELDLVTRDAVDQRPGVRVHNGLTPNSPELMELYRSADVFVLPSRGECFGIATIEAMATGLPVIQSAVGGVDDIIADGQNGYIVEPGSPVGLGAAIDAVLSDPSRWAAMGRRSRQLATERFDMSTNARVTVDHLIELAAGSTAGRREGRAS